MFIFRNASFKLIGPVLIVLVSVLILIQIGFSLTGLETSSREAALRSAREAIDHAALQCYALEGAYPADIRYLVEHYGLQLQEDRYLYYYEAAGGNLAPMIEVIPR